jgi:hypothetical protein
MAPQGQLFVLSKSSVYFFQSVFFYITSCAGSATRNIRTRISLPHLRNSRRANVVKNEKLEDDRKLEKENIKWKEYTRFTAYILS